MRATRYFYGWAVVAALSVVGGLSMGMGVGNFGFFIAPMSEELDMGLTPFGLAATARLIGFAVSAPLIGRAEGKAGTSRSGVQRRPRVITTSGRGLTQTA